MIEKLLIINKYIHCRRYELFIVMDNQININLEFDFVVRSCFLYVLYIFTLIVK